MTTLDRITNNLRDTVDQLAEGWQEFWQKARNAITRFTPATGDASHPLAATSSRWGVLSAELRELDDRIEVQLEAPGMDASDFDIRVDHGALHVRGAKQYANDRRQGRYYITERAYGSFERVIPLPSDVDEQSASASYRKGVLEISLRKREEAKPRRITVSVTG